MAQIEPIQVKVAIDVVADRLAIFDRQAQWLCDNYPYWAPEIAGPRLLAWLENTREALDASVTFSPGSQ